LREQNSFLLWLFLVAQQQWVGGTATTTVAVTTTTTPTPTTTMLAITAKYSHSKAT